MSVKYEVESERTEVTPKDFWRYCSKLMKKHGADIENWTTFEEFENPTTPQEYTCNLHEDWDRPKTEIIKLMPYDWQIFLEDTYNFIMEFEFDTERKGHGYLYAVEYEA
ncbi:MAG: hypothetical protein MSH24_06225 [Lachnospiraceae bacterium]|nr:hypothetical protein [Lachnospiraceae bacterium]